MEQVQQAVSEEEALPRTSAVLVLSSEHGRMRRAQRMLEKRDLQAAVAHGACVVSINQRGQQNLKYTFGGVVYITDMTSTREITSWAEPGAGLDVPIVLITPEMRVAHTLACGALADKSKWTSHTVVVVDTSGSMRTTDVAGGATRADAVWLTLGLDYVAKGLEMRHASATDVLSVVGMQASATVLIDRKPMDWLVFNDVIRLLRSAEPMFEGNYLPAIEAAEELLLSNSLGGCALNLLFLSDGRPSDQGVNVAKEAKERIGALASRFGRRLSVSMLGFGAPNEPFELLERMAAHTSVYGSLGTFSKVSLRPESLGLALSSLAKTLTATRTELTELGGTAQRSVRDIRREPKTTVDDSFPTPTDWLLYESIGEREVGANGPRRFVWNVDDKEWQRAAFQSPAGSGVAVRRFYFGEGAERIVRKFREVDSCGNFVGPLLVAKEGRFQCDLGSGHGGDVAEFHRVFCDAQTRAAKLAAIFNEKLAHVPGVDESTPRVHFLDCSVYVVDDDADAFGDQTAFLVEKQLDVCRYKKWNDNRGGLNGLEPTLCLAQNAPLEAILESGDDDDLGDDDCDVAFTDDEIPQAFSHFTYRYTKRRLLVCDLQGVLTTAADRRQFEFTDPVVHYKSRTGRSNVFGRTDLGRRGMCAFLKTHVCGHLCRSLSRRWVAGAQKSPHLPAHQGDENDD